MQATFRDARRRRQQRGRQRVQGTPHRRGRQWALAAAAAAGLGDRTWDRGAGTNNWNDAANWNPDSVPGSSDAAIFTDTGAGTVDLNGVSQPPGSGSLLGVTFNNATTGYTVQATGSGTI